jgi:hypothetical protein
VHGTLDHAHLSCLCTLFALHHFDQIDTLLDVAPASSCLRLDHIRARFGNTRCNANTKRPNCELHCGVRVGNVLESLRTRIARSFSAQDNNGDSNVVVQVLPATAVQPLVSERPKQTQVVMAVDHTVRRVLEEF